MMPGTSGFKNLCLYEYNGRLLNKAFFGAFVISFIRLQIHHGPFRPDRPTDVANLARREADMASLTSMPFLPPQGAP